MAICLSLLVHALPLLPIADWLRDAPPRPPPLLAQLRPPLPAAADLIVPDPPRFQPAPPPTTGKPISPPQTWQNAMGQQLRQWYSNEAIRLGLEGQVIVFFILDESGNVSAARVEQGSGSPILDRDALAAVRNLRALPAETPREMLLPLRFRLKD
mgnify:CR=1 FL=1